jgi:hypothetical protein
VDFSIHRGCWNQCPADIKGSYVKNVHFIKVCRIEDNISVEIQKKFGITVIQVLEGAMRMLRSIGTKQFTENDKTLGVW